MHLIIFCVVLWVVLQCSCCDSLQHHVGNGGHLVKNREISYRSSVLGMSAVARDVVRHAEHAQSKRDQRLKAPNTNVKLDGPTIIPPPPKITVLLPSKQSPSYFRTKPSGEYVSWHHVFSKISDKIGTAMLYSIHATSASRVSSYTYMHRMGGDERQV